MAVPLLRVSNASPPHMVAGAIAQVLREQRVVNIQAIGAGAVNQMVKAAIIARQYLEGDGLDLCFVPAFHDVDVGECVRTAVRLRVERVEVAAAQDETEGG